MSPATLFNYFPNKGALAEAWVRGELDEVVPSWTGAPTLRLSDRIPDLRLPPAVWRWWHDEESTPSTPGAFAP